MHGETSKNLANVTKNIYHWKSSWRQKSVETKDKSENKFHSQRGPTGWSLNANLDRIHIMHPKNKHTYRLYINRILSWNTLLKLETPYHFRQINELLGYKFTDFLEKCLN